MMKKSERGVVQKPGLGENCWVQWAEMLRALQTQQGWGGLEAVGIDQRKHRNILMIILSWSQSRNCLDTRVSLWNLRVFGLHWFVSDQTDLGWSSVLYLTHLASPLLLPTLYSTQSQNLLLCHLLLLSCFMQLLETEKLSRFVFVSFGVFKI